ncbi:outer membrane beta-barrel domain-containing protein [Halioxenophilus sp. WMMB6]|uniref:outer membrane beta-barrel domain-containing protein n=1 Tax=Halioxenophilus sp. WMMB6 TaxID=3073815 RepID=UPI00295EBC32|nr:outer membrane beta-barrel domain-containing protein [Halioxenophilus sp. WMMB6]
MAIRLNRILLGVPLLAGVLSANAFAQEEVLDDIITPDLERRTIKEGAIDSENFEVGLYAGILNIEDFGSNDVVGFRVAYHLSELLFFEGAAGQSRLQETSFERLSGDIQLLTDDQRDLTYYNLSVGFNFFPGEVFLGSKFAMNTNFYFIAGLGNTQFADEEHFTYNFGAGINMLPTDWLSIRFDVRDYLFEHDLFGETVDTNNLEASLGLNIYF